LFKSIPKVVILKVIIEVDQGASTFWMCGPLGVKGHCGHFSVDE